MSDLVQRLRDRAYSARAGDPLCAEAADAIARLRLTDAEREAVEWCVEMALLHATDCEEEVATLRGLLERLR